jgi:CMP-N,N'-diacetyllegionaminic acid synthase
VNNFVIIPARIGSKGVHRKNLIKIHHQSLIIRSILHARKLVKDHNILISTDSPEIINEIANYFNLISPFVTKNSINQLGDFKVHYRDSSLSSDQTLISEVLLSIYDILNAQGNRPLSFCLLQPTSPFRSSRELTKIKKILRLNQNPNISLVSVTEVGGFHPARMYKTSKNNKLSRLSGFEKFFNSRRQDLPKIYIRDGGFYIIGRNLIEKRLQYSQAPQSLVRVFPWTINIDSESDLKLAASIKIEEVYDDPSGAEK